MKEGWREERTKREKSEGTKVEGQGFISFPMRTAMLCSYSTPDRAISGASYFNTQPGPLKERGRREGTQGRTLINLCYSIHYISTEAFLTEKDLHMLKEFSTSVPID